MNIIDVQTVVPTNRCKALAQFNKITGVFTGLFQEVNESFLNHDYFNYVPIEIDMSSQRVVGTYSDFKIVNVADDPQVIYESALDKAKDYKINKMYPISTRLEIIERFLEKISASGAISNSEFDEMRAVINEINLTNSIRKKSLENDPLYKYVSLEQELEIKNAQLEGGLHEFIGPCSNHTGRI